MSNRRSRHGRSKRGRRGAVLFALVAATAQIRATETYIADVWIAGKRVAEVNLSLERGAAGEITQLKAGTTMREPGFGGYSFEQDSEQVWTDGRLQYFTSTSQRGGDERRVELNGHDGGIAGLADDNTVDFPVTAAPATIWCDYPATASVLFDPVDATSLTVQVTNMGSAEQPAGAAPVGTVRYEFTGGWVRTVWYTENGLLVQARFQEQGNEVHVRLRDSQASN